MNSSVFDVMNIREECRLKLFENRILRYLFEPKGNVNGEWRRLHNEIIYTIHLIESG